MNARAGSNRAAARYDFVHSILIQGASATKVKSVGGRLARRVTLEGIYCLEILTQGSSAMRSGTYKNPLMTPVASALCVDNVWRLSTRCCAKEMFGCSPIIQSWLC